MSPPAQWNALDQHHQELLYILDLVDYGPKFHVLVNHFGTASVINHCTIITIAFEDLAFVVLLQG